VTPITVTGALKVLMSRRVLDGTCDLEIGFDDVVVAALDEAMIGIDFDGAAALRDLELDVVEPIARRAADGVHDELIAGAAGDLDAAREGLEPSVPPAGIGSVRSTVSVSRGCAVALGALGAGRGRRTRAKSRVRCGSGDHVYSMSRRMAARVYARMPTSKALAAGVIALPRVHLRALQPVGPCRRLPTLSRPIELRAAVAELPSCCATRPARSGCRRNWIMLEHQLRQSRAQWPNRRRRAPTGQRLEPEQRLRPRIGPGKPRHFWRRSPSLPALVALRGAQQ
jgi:hypothetical protein